MIVCSAGREVCSYVSLGTSFVRSATFHVSPAKRGGYGRDRGEGGGFQTLVFEKTSLTGFNICETFGLTFRMICLIILC